MRSRTLIALIIVVVIVAGSVAGFYLYTSQQTQPVQNVNFSLGSTLDQISTMNFAAAKFWGYYQHNNVNVTYQTLAGGPLSFQALVAKQSDLGYGSFGAALSAIAGGAPIKVIAYADTGATYVIVANTKIQTPADLKGANWGVESIGGTSYSASLAYLNSIGMKASDVNFVVVGFIAVRYQALIAQKIDVALVTPDIAIKVGQYPYLHVLVSFQDFHKLVPYLPFGAIATRTDVLQNNPQMLQNVLKGYIQAARALASNESLFAATLTRMAPAGAYNASQLQTIYSGISSGFFTVNGGLNTVLLKQFAQYYSTIENPKAANIVNSSSILNFVDFSTMKSVLKSLGTQQSSWDVPDFSLSIIGFPTGLAVPPPSKID